MSDQSRGQPQLSLKERIAALQQLNGNASTQRTPPTTNRVPSGSSAAVQNRIATFEEKGTTTPPGVVASPGMSRSPSSHSSSHNRRRSFYGGEQDDGTTISPLLPSHTGGSFISPMHTGGSFKEPIVRSTDFQAALGRARRAERRSSGAFSKSASESTEAISRASSPPSSFPLADPIGLVTSEPEAIVATDMATPPSVNIESFSAAPEKPEMVTEKDTMDAPSESVPVPEPEPQPVKDAEPNGRTSVTVVSATGSRVQSLDTVRAEKSLDVPPFQETPEPKPIPTTLPSSPPRKAASVKLPKSRPSQSANTAIASTPSQPEIMASPPKPKESENSIADMTESLSRIDGLPSLGFDLADLLQNAAMLEEHLIDGKSPAEQTTTTSTPSVPAPQPQVSLHPPADESSTKSREPSVERREARPRPKSTLMNTFSRISNRRSTALETKEVPVPTLVQPDEERPTRAAPSTPPQSTAPLPSDNLSPTKSPGKYFTSLRRLTNGSRSASSASGSRYSLSASSEISSSEDSHPVLTPSEASEFGSRDNKFNGSSMLSPKKSSHSLGKAASFAGKMFGRSRTKSNNSTTTPNDFSERTSFMSVAPPLPQIPQETFDFKLNVPGIPSSPVEETSTQTQSPPAITRSGAPRLGPISILSTTPSSPASSAASPLFDFDSFPAPPTPNTIRQGVKSRSGETIPGAPSSS